MEKKIIGVFHQGFKGDQITHDLHLRLLAAGVLAKQNSDCVICFLGGGKLKPTAGSQTMCEFWKKQYPRLPNTLTVLDNANNTAGILKEVARSAKRESSTEIILVSNTYHKKRISLLAAKYLPSAEIISAEKVLLDNKIDVKETKRYLKSLEYKIKEAKEFFIRFFLRLDPEQKMIEKWRTLYRKN
jgi:hypothetical protein